MMLADDMHSLLHGRYDDEGKEVNPGIIPAAYHTLQGNNVSVEWLRNRLVKRLYLHDLVPDIVAPDQWSWEVNECNWLSYIDNLTDSFEPIWQAVQELGLCTAQQVEAARNQVLMKLEGAVEKGRQRYREQPRFTSWHIPFDGYPEWLEFPPIRAEPELPWIKLAA